MNKYSYFITWKLYYKYKPTYMHAYTYMKVYLALNIINLHDKTLFL